MNDEVYISLIEIFGKGVSLLIKLLNHLGIFLVFAHPCSNNASRNQTYG